MTKWTDTIRQRLGYVLQRACLIPCATLLLSLSTAGFDAKPGYADALEELEKAWQALFDKTAPSVVFIGANDRFGSGFAIGQQGLILTNRHVVGTQRDVKVVLLDGRQLAGTVVELAREDVDLALVQVPVGALAGLPFESTKDLRVGSWAAAIGHGSGGIWTYTSGMITNLYPTGRDRWIFQTQVPINPGNSGGPVVDRRGRVLGIATAVLDGASNIAFGIRIERALQVLDGVAEACGSCLTVVAPAGVPVLVDGQMVGKGRVTFFAQPKTYTVMAVVDGKMKAETVVFPKVRLVDLSK